MGVEEVDTAQRYSVWIFILVGAVDPRLVHFKLYTT